MRELAVPKNMRVHTGVSDYGHLHEYSLAVMANNGKPLWRGGAALHGRQIRTVEAMKVIDILIERFWRYIGAA